MLPSTPVHVVVALLEDLPSLSALLEGPSSLVSLSPEFRAVPFVVFAKEHADTVKKALSKLTPVEPFGDKPAGADWAELQALSGEVCDALEAQTGLYRTEKTGYFSTSVLAVGDATVEQVQEALDRAKLSWVRAATLPDLRPRSQAEALALVEKALSGAPRKTREQVLELLTTRGPMPVKRVKALDNYAVGEALGIEVERWHPQVSERLLTLWLEARTADEKLSFNDGQPAFGVDRPRRLVAQLEKAGASPSVARFAALSLSGPFRYGLLVAPKVLEAAFVESPVIGRALAAEAVGAIWLASSPSYEKRVSELAASHHPALGAEALNTISEKWPHVLDRAHFEGAASDPQGERLQWAAARVEAASKKNAGMVSVALSAWAARATPSTFSQQMQRILRDEKRPFVIAAVWDALAAVLEARPEAPFEEGDRQFDDVLAAYARIAKPNKEVAARIAAWLESPPGKSLTLSSHFAGGLAKKVGKAPKLKPLPYSEKDLAKLPAAQAKAFKAARERSWKAGVKLPRGVAPKALADAEKVLAAKLPAEVRAFFLLHDGAGRDECFNGCRLYSLKEAVAQRKQLLDLARKGAQAFDEAWLPLTDDGGGNHHCLVLSGKQAGQIIDFDHETGGGRKISPSFNTFVQGASWGDEENS